MVAALARLLAVALVVGQPATDAHSLPIRRVRRFPFVDHGSFAQRSITSSIDSNRSS
jgi:hypothetical protein